MAIGLIVGSSGIVFGIKKRDGINVFVGNGFVVVRRRPSVIRSTTLKTKDRDKYQEKISF